MPKINYDTAKQQLKDLLSTFNEKKSNIEQLVDTLDDKKVKDIADRLLKDIEDEHWASTGATQTIQATINVKVVPRNND
ncbi:MAG: hypothetical protein M0D57_21205 [Sphingobacteriales bacterium JAD_PAG50586_3]|nr:MAG: hypothetical protein M0D57_21205 [Sphingobacteriales bacterium JAD_PAG50586_3]